MLYAQTIAYGANEWISVFPDDLREKEMEVIKKYNLFVKDNKYYFQDTKSKASAALVWSVNTADYYSGSEVPLSDFTHAKSAEGPGNMTAEFNGFYEMLTRSQVPFDVIDEYVFNNISKYRLVILPNSACLSKEHVKLLQEYVRNGGVLIGTFESSLYNEFGEKQDTIQLSDVFGISGIEKIVGPLKWDYIVPKIKHKLLNGITKKYLPAPKYELQVKTNNNTSLICFCEKLAGCYDGIPKITDYPFYTLNKFSRGYGIYFAGTFGESFNEFRFKEYLQIMKNIINWSKSNRLFLENGPNSIDVSLREKEGDIILHLINYTGEMTRPIQK